MRLKKSISVYTSLPFFLFTLYFCPGGLIQGFSLPKEEAYTSVLLIGIRKEARSQVLHLTRIKRYTLTPEKLKWDKFKLTYKYSASSDLVCLGRELQAETFSDDRQADYCKVTIRLKHSGQNEAFRPHVEENAPLLESMNSHSNYINTMLKD